MRVNGKIVAERYEKAMKAKEFLWHFIMLIVKRSQ